MTEKVLSNLVGILHQNVLCIQHESLQYFHSMTVQMCVWFGVMFKHFL